MSPSLLDRILHRSSGSFLGAARERGVSARAARALEPAARETAPAGPEAIFASRELFERAAALAVIGDAGNLELSYRLVDLLATTVERLGLARSSDVPDPFRRVWVETESGQTRRGVVFRCEAGEIAVFCPPGGKAVEIGSVLRLRYRGFQSSVDYELRLNDAVRLPGAHVLHLTRLDGLGAIGRVHPRYDVKLDGRLCGDGEPFGECQVLDISAGGVRAKTARTFEIGQYVKFEAPLDDGDESPFASRAEVRWVAALPAGQALGLLFDDLPPPERKRLTRYLKRLARSAAAQPAPPSSD